MKKYIFIIIGLVGFLSTYAQNQFDVRFNLTDINCETGVACYDIQVSSVSSTAFVLGGQNYRIYYDNSKANYISGSSSLPSPAFTDYTVIQDIGPSDASGFSNNLGFESTLGFLNFTIDLNDVDNGSGITIPSNGTWVTTSNICFVVDQAVIDSPGECLEIVWAKDGYTNDLATAFVEVVEWVASQNTQTVDPTSAATHNNMDSSDGDQACFNDACNITVPNISIADDTVNESDAGVSQCVTVTLSETTTEDITIDYLFINGSATNSSDYNGTSSSITINAGNLTADICFDVVDDTQVEGNETFSISLFNASIGNFTDSLSEITIIDNDVACAAQAPVISGN